MDFNNFRKKYLQAFIKGTRKKQSKEMFTVATERQLSSWPVSH